ncbi:hypothetical protein HPB47_000822, partial [Ixodes persulcatus]
TAVSPVVVSRAGSGRQIAGPLRESPVSREDPGPDRLLCGVAAGGSTVLADRALPPHYKSGAILNPRRQAPRAASGPPARRALKCLKSGSDSMLGAPTRDRPGRLPRVKRWIAFCRLLARTAGQDLEQTKRLCPEYRLSNIARQSEAPGEGSLRAQLADEPAEFPVAQGVQHPRGKHRTAFPLTCLRDLPMVCLSICSAAPSYLSLFRFPDLNSSGGLERLTDSQQSV